MELPHFRYFPDPAAAESIAPSTDTCRCCGRTCGWVFKGEIYGYCDDLKPVCPWCIADGTIANKHGGALNSLHTDAVVPAEIRDEIECRTPNFATWQDLQWPDCCNDGCVFLGYAKRTDLEGHWKDALGALYRAESSPKIRYGPPEAFLDAIEDGDANPGVYIFQCTHCGGYKPRWDDL